MIKTMRIAIIHIGQETNDFNPVPTTLRDFESFGIYEGPAIVEKLHGLGQVGGYLEAVAESNRRIETIPIIRGWATAGGRIDAESLHFFEKKMVSSFGRNLPSLPRPRPWPWQSLTVTPGK